MSNDLMRIMRLADLQVFGVPRDEMNREQQPLLYKASERRTFHNQYRSDSDTTVMIHRGASTVCSSPFDSEPLPVARARLLQVSGRATQSNSMFVATF